METDEYRVAECPDTAIYIPNFIAEKEETYLLKEVYRAPRTKWTVLSNRRLQNWGGVPQPKGMLQEPLPTWLQDCCKKITQLGVFGELSPNHVLVNEYKPGQGIMPHEDGPLYFPTVSTISLGSHTVLEFYDSLKHSDGAKGQKFSLLLERRSLLILQDDMYKSYMHGIKEISSDYLRKEDIFNLNSLGDKFLKQKLLGEEECQLERTTRVSLTIRYVPKSIKLNLQIGKLSK